MIKGFPVIMKLGEGMMLLVKNQKAGLSLDYGTDIYMLA